MGKQWKEWQIYFLWLQNHCNHDDCKNETKRYLLLGRKAMTNLEIILKSRDSSTLHRHKHPPSVRSELSSQTTCSQLQGSVPKFMLFMVPPPWDQVLLTDLSDVKFSSTCQHDCQFLATIRYKLTKQLLVSDDKGLLSGQWSWGKRQESWAVYSLISPWMGALSRFIMFIREREVAQSLRPSATS